ncbi:MAG: helix-turn-helix domain-containing protein [Gaiellaceae bacterium]
MGSNLAVPDAFVQMDSRSVRPRLENAVMERKRTDHPFVEEVPRLLEERDLSIRALARRAAVTDAHLSRVLRQVNYKTPSADLARRIAIALDLPEDYFPEFREAFVIDEVRRDPRLREQLYARLRRPPRR